MLSHVHVAADDPCVLCLEAAARLRALRDAARELCTWCRGPNANICQEPEPGNADSFTPYMHRVLCGDRGFTTCEAHRVWSLIRAEFGEAEVRL